MAFDKALLGRILASVAIAAVDAGEIALDPHGIATNPQEINDILDGFLSIWITHPASGQNPGQVGQIGGGKTTP